MPGRLHALFYAEYGGNLLLGYQGLLAISTLFSAIIRVIQSVKLAEEMNNGQNESAR